MKSPVFAHAPPANLHTMALQGQPRRDIGFMIHFTDYDLFALPQSVGQSQAHDPDKRRRIHAEGHFPWVAGVQESGNTFASVLDCLVHFLAPAVASTALHVALQKMVMDGIQHNLRNLGSSAIVEKNEFVSGMEGGERSADPFNRKTKHSRLSVVEAADISFPRCPRRSHGTGDTGGSRCTSPCEYRGVPLPGWLVFHIEPAPG